MLIGELTDCQPLTGKIMFGIIGRTVGLQCKCTDSGLRPNLFVQNFALMYYFINFFRRHTRHHLYGALNAYAYTNEDGTRAFINLRMSVTGVRPFASLNENNEVIPSRAIKMQADRHDNEKNDKLKNMIYKYVWQNIDNEDVVQQQRLNKEVFAICLADLHEDLCTRNIIFNGQEVNPMLVNERIVRQRRHVDRLAERGATIDEYLWNPHVPFVDWESPALVLEQLLNPRLAFPEELTHLTPEQMAFQQLQQQARQQQQQAHPQPQQQQQQHTEEPVDETE